MRLARYLAAAILCALATDSVVADDLCSVPRIIRRQPEFKSQPGYCLLILGPQAQTRIWLVLDGDVLYVDRNAKGDLTEPGDKVTSDKDGVFHIGKIREIGTLIFERGNGVYPHPVMFWHDAELRRIEKDQGKGKEILYLLWLNVSGHKESAGVEFAPSPEEAPVLHFDGLRTMGLAVEFRRPKEMELQAFVGSRGCKQGKSGVFTELSFDVVPPGISPVADIEFAPRDARGKPIHVTASLKQRC